MVNEDKKAKKRILDSLEYYSKQATKLSQELGIRYSRNHKTIGKKDDIKEIWELLHVIKKQTDLPVTNHGKWVSFHHTFDLFLSLTVVFLLHRFMGSLQLGIYCFIFPTWWQVIIRGVCFLSKSPPPLLKTIFIPRNFVMFARSEPYLLVLLGKIKNFKGKWITFWM